MKVLFTCNASKSGGIGHLIRSIALAEQVRLLKFESFFLGKFETPFAQRIISQSGFLSEDFAGHSAELADRAAELGVDIVHCDDYAPRLGLHEALSQHGILFSNIEDGAYGRRSADLLLDPSPGAEFLYRQNGSGAVHLRGLRYLPLRQEIFAASSNRRARSQASEMADRKRPSVLIVLGGTDAAGATSKIVDLWTESVQGTTCFAVLPGQQQPFVETRGTSEIHWLPPTPHMASLYSEVDAVITAAGTTIWEVAAVGIPAAVIQQAKNQLSNYRYAVDRGGMLGLGTAEDISTNTWQIRAAMKQLLRLAVPSIPAVDTAGANRVVSEWANSKAEVQNLRIREARLSDASNLFDWRNDALVRSVSRVDKPISWEDHLRWLGPVLASTDRKLLVAMNGRGLAGTTRFDKLDGSAGQWEISLALSPGSRGKGLGRELLTRSEAWLRAQVTGDLEVIAHVKRYNDSSTLLFAKNGYTQLVQGNTSEFVQWKKRLVHSM